MTANVSAKALVGSVKVAASKLLAIAKHKDLKAGFYFIRRTTAGGNKCEIEIGYFHRAEEGRSLYLGKWQIFDKITQVYHVPEKIEVFNEVPFPVVV